METIVTAVHKLARLIIPEHRPEILQRLHWGHQGINKNLLLGQERDSGGQALYLQVVERCEICACEAQTLVEPLPKGPSKQILVDGVADLFQWQNRNYFHMIDYFSSYK